MNYFEQIIDQLDAAVFTGDLLENPANCKMLKEHCKRWFRALAEREPLTPVEAEEQFPPYINFACGHDMRIIDGMFSNEELMQIAYVAYQVKDI